MRLLHAIILAIGLAATPVIAAECDTATDLQIQDAIKAEPQKLIKILEGEELAAFFANMIKQGYMVGSLQLVDKVYIVEAGKLPGYTTDNVWLFFVQDGCLIRAIPASKDIIMGLL